MPLGSLIAVLEHGPVAQDEFDDWYDTEHIPERLDVPGFLRAQRWAAADGSPVSVVLYDLEDLAVLDGEAYRSIGGENLSPWSKRVIGRCDRFLRYAAEQLVPGDATVIDDAGGLLVFAMDVDPAAEEDSTTGTTPNTSLRCVMCRECCSPAASGCTGATTATSRRTT
jgi:hypothetical protein